MKLRRIIICVLYVLLGLVSAKEYRTLSFADLEGATGYVSLTGFYETNKSFSNRIEGKLSWGDYSLEVRGGKFDWLPPGGHWVVLWGELKQDEGQVYLNFHNGHPLLEPRDPRPAPERVLGERISVWLTVSMGGSSSRLFYQGLSEDRQLFILDNYQGKLGLQCLTGVELSATLGRRLGDIRPCD
ncbi:MAG: hypothetical protein KC422_04885 [Trueperaceae bacterium]|nr:hypothetical protein [Trueperaceae bacterium]